MTRSERIQELRHRMGDHSEPNIFESIVDTGRGELTVIEVAAEGITHYTATWMPPLTTEEDGQ